MEEKNKPLDASAKEVLRELPGQQIKRVDFRDDGTRKILFLEFMEDKGFQLVVMGEGLLHEIAILQKKEIKPAPCRLDVLTSENKQLQDEVKRLSEGLEYIANWYSEDVAGRLAEKFLKGATTNEPDPAL